MDWASSSGSVISELGLHELAVVQGLKAANVLDDGLGSTSVKGALNRSVVISRANCILILNTEWSPETAFQAEGRCHGQGRWKDVLVHYSHGKAPHGCSGFLSGKGDYPGFHSQYSPLR